MTIAARMMDLGTETAFDVLAKARALEAQGKEIIHLEIGEPDFDTPRHIVEAGMQALSDGFTHYGPTAGLPELREAIARGEITADPAIAEYAAQLGYPVWADFLAFIGFKVAVQLGDWP